MAMDTSGLLTHLAAWDKCLVVSFRTAAQSVGLPDRQSRRDFDSYFDFYFDVDRSWRRSASLCQSFLLPVFVLSWFCVASAGWPVGCIILLCKLVARCAGCACLSSLHNSHTKHRAVPQRTEPRTRASGTLRTVWTDRPVVIAVDSELWLSKTRPTWNQTQLCRSEKYIGQVV